MSGNGRRLYNFQGNVASREAEHYGGKLEIKCVMLRMKTIISQEKVSKRIARMCKVNMGTGRNNCSSTQIFLK